ncbi:MAG TPA: DoxX family protein [Polyangiaceae bacterium]|nr:DoxX family protein [Polyangiaceae bacterium]
MEAFLKTDRNNSLLAVQRALLGAVMFPHGAQKLLGWFGGYGFDGTMQFFTQTLRFPAVLALLVILAESIGALLLLAGLGTRLAAFGISAVMLGAILTTHWKVGFFMNWFGNQAGEGYEFHLLALALAVPLVIAGGGRCALDSWLSSRLRMVAGPARAAALS